MDHAQSPPTHRLFLMPRPQRRDVWPDGSGSRSSWSTLQLPGALDQMAGSISSTWATSVTSSEPGRLMWKMVASKYPGRPDDSQNSRACGVDTLVNFNESA